MGFVFKNAEAGGNIGNTFSKANPMMIINKVSAQVQSVATFSPPIKDLADANAQLGIRKVDLIGPSSSYRPHKTSRISKGDFQIAMDSIDRWNLV